MTRLEILGLISDWLGQVDVARGSLLPGEPQREELDRLRRELDKRHQRLAQSLFDDNTESFRDAAAKLKGVNDEIQAALTAVQGVAQTIHSIGRILAAVDQVIGVIPV